MDFIFYKKLLFVIVQYKFLCDTKNKTDVKKNEVEEIFNNHQSHVPDCEYLIKESFDCHYKPAAILTSYHM